MSKIQKSNLLRIVIYALSFLALVWMPLFAYGNSTIVSRYVPQAQAIGKGKLSMFFVDTYNATLYAPEGKWQADKPYALTISYLRKIKGSIIANYTIDAIRRQGFENEGKLADWNKRLHDLFSDVEPSTTMIGVRCADGSTIFYRDDAIIGSISDEEFSDRFFGIWLSEATFAPELRKKLLGI